MQLELKRKVCGSPKCKDATGCTWVGQQSLLRMTVVRMVEMTCVQLIAPCSQTGHVALKLSPLVR